MVNWRGVTDGDIVNVAGAVVNKSAGTPLATVTAIVTRVPFASVTTTLAAPSATGTTLSDVPATDPVATVELLD